ncbi:hypothetical protein [Bradyrhizobium guangxiense]|uniref:hypothetical protein n=1 Tax=Bradyrhizobium guangxiense TaxID=1325115 RepID=UPI001008DA4F|nr:hypothetical protein [Bradyrhizobium guangxiense]
MLRRIPAVKWAFARLRPAPHGGSIDVPPAVEDVSPVINEDTTAKDIAAETIAEAASADVTVTNTVSARDDADLAAPSLQDDTAISIVAESPPAAPTDASANDDSSRETPSDIEPVVEPESSVPAAEIEVATEDAPEPVISNDPAVEIAVTVESVDVEPVATDAVSQPVEAAEPGVSTDPIPVEAEADVLAETSSSPLDVEGAPVDAPALVTDDDCSPDANVDVEPTLGESRVTSADAEAPAEPAPENRRDSAPSLGDAMVIEPAAADLAVPAVAQHSSTEAASVVTDIETAPVLVSPSPQRRSTPKARARAAEPTDRATLIRQRWAESGIRMWNPRLHGTGEATLNIQGSIGLLPPAPGETMPRYDKLEFKLLGGQIVCEGVIVDAPVQASHRNFTRLAEPGKLERVREPARERQAALA